MKLILCNNFVLILVLHFEQRLTILDGELRHHRTCPENIAVPHDVMALDLGEIPQFLATRLASCDVPSPSPALPTSPPESQHSGKRNVFFDPILFGFPNTCQHRHCPMNRKLSSQKIQQSAPSSHCELLTMQSTSSTMASLKAQTHLRIAAILCASSYN